MVIGHQIFGIISTLLCALSDVTLAKEVMIKTVLITKTFSQLQLIINFCSSKNSK